MIAKIIFIQLTVYGLLFLTSSSNISAQMNPGFFPDFIAHSGNPIIKYGDGFADATWNDPTVLKLNGQYIMYMSASVGISSSNVVSIYRLISSDGYSWNLSPSNAVVVPDSGTYYAGSVETPSVVIKDSVYHMYLTAYPPGNLPDEFVIAHATSPDGINWVMDTVPILESDGSATWNGTVVGEPGAIVYHDSIYVFFTAAGVQGFNQIQCIGLIKSADGSIFGPPEQAVLLPELVYPLTSNYIGLSTPSALAINDSIYLFTDVAQNVNGIWTQVALHQFKRDGLSGVWYNDDASIHTMQDFTWTNGSFYSELRSITPLMDDNGLLRIWYAGNRLADVVGNDTIYHATLDSLGNLHVDPDFWGIGTSEYQFTNSSGIAGNISGSFSFFPNPCSDKLMLAVGKDKVIQLKILNLLGQVVFNQTLNSSPYSEISISHLRAGLYFIKLEESTGEVYNGNLVISK